MACLFLGLFERRTLQDKIRKLSENGFQLPQDTANMAFRTAPSSAQITECTLVSWSHGAMVLRFHGTMALGAGGRPETTSDANRT